MYRSEWHDPVDRFNKIRWRTTVTATVYIFFFFFKEEEEEFHFCFYLGHCHTQN